MITGSASERSIHHRLVTTTVSSGVATVCVSRPQIHNVLNPATMFQLHQSILAAANDPLVRGIVLTAEGKTFVMGADIGYLIRSIEQDRVQRIVDFAVAGHACFNTIRQCSKPVVAALNGSALGGGLELAMSCSYRVAVPPASMALPETGLGIFPGWGGAFRSAQLLGQGVAKWLVYTGKTVSAKEALALGLVDYIVMPDMLEELAHKAALGTVPESPCRCAPSVDVPALERYFTTHGVDQILNGDADAFGNPLLAKIPRQLASKGPIGLRCAERLFAEADLLSVEERMESELKMTWDIYHTHDALLGLNCLQQGRIGRIPFEGR